MSEDFEEWLKKKENRIKKKGTYRERVLRGEQKNWINSSRKKLRKVSKKESSRLTKYKKASKKYLKDHPRCEICGSRNNLSIHHKMGRSGDYLFDKAFFMTTCLIGKCLDIKYPNSVHNHTGGCHGWIESNKKKSRKLGFILYG